MQAFSVQLNRGEQSLVCRFFFLKAFTRSTPWKSSEMCSDLRHPGLPAYVLLSASARLQYVMSGHGRNAQHGFLLPAAWFLMSGSLSADSVTKWLEINEQKYLLWYVHCEHLGALSTPPYQSFRNHCPVTSVFSIFSSENRKLNILCNVKETQLI